MTYDLRPMMSHPQTRFSLLHWFSLFSLLHWT